MTTKDLENLIRWCCDTDGEKFAQDMYAGNMMNEYKRGKFMQMQENLMGWITSLDSTNRENLIKAINKND